MRLSLPPSSGDASPASRSEKLCEPLSSPKAGSARSASSATADSSTAAGSSTAADSSDVAGSSANVVSSTSGGSSTSVRSSTTVTSSALGGAWGSWLLMKGSDSSTSGGASLVGSSGSMSCVSAVLSTALPSL